MSSRSRSSSSGGGGGSSGGGGGGGGGDGRTGSTRASPLNAVAALVAALVAATELSQIPTQASLLSAAVETASAGASAAAQTAAGALGRAAVNTVQDAVLETALESLTADSEEGLPDVTSVVEAAVADPKAAGDLVGEVAAGGAGLVATRAASHLLVQGVGQALAGTVGVPVRLLHSLADWLHFFLLDRLAATPLGAGAAATVAQGAVGAARHAVVDAVEGVVQDGIQEAAGLSD